jgi:hypothetical protein
LFVRSFQLVGFGEQSILVVRSFVFQVVLVVVGFVLVVRFARVLGDDSRLGPETFTL